MGVLLACNEISKTFGTHRLFSSLSLSVHEGDRLGLIGPNGSGKTTLLEILAGAETPDAGDRALRKGARVAYAPQESEFAPDATAQEVARAAAADLQGDDAAKAVRVGVVLGKAGFVDQDVPTGTLSGGWKKRLAIAAALVQEPDVLLLDEPTNHLDLDGIAWLEELLRSERLACVFVTHDRWFLENVSTAVAEINPVFPGGVFRTTGSYSTFLERREAFLEAQAKRRESLANKVRGEIEWLRRGPKARTGKSRSRIDSAGRLIDQLAEAEGRSRGGAAGIEFMGSDRKTKRLIAAEGVAKSLGGRALFRDLSLVLSPGSRLGVVGPNGGGKTTLIRTLLGEIAPDAGRVERAEGLRVASLDQHRAGLDPALSLRESLAPDGDSVVRDGALVHVNAWAKRFLFREEQLKQPTGDLSGGERARVAIARLMLEPADLLTLDEPTNDLDLPTLEVLEETLLEFPGAVVLVTHDRFLLDRVSTTIVGLDGDGDSGVYADRLQWEEARAAKRRKPRAEKPRSERAAAPAPSKKLSYLEQREFDGIERRIVDAERELAAAEEELNDPANAVDHERLRRVHERLERAQAAVDELYRRWAELEEKLAS